MKNIRLGNDISVVWTVTSGTAIDLDNAVVELYDQFGQKATIGAVTTTALSTSVYTFAFTFYGKDQHTTGVYRILLKKNAGNNGMITLDKVDAWQLSSVCDFGIVEGEDDSHITTVTVELSSNTATHVEGGGDIDPSLYYTKTETDALLGGKEDTIEDLSTIRSGASAGATAYQKPSGGIPSTDMSSVVQTSLGKADTALQSHQDISGKADKVTSATNGNFAALDSNGNLTDSGHKHSDYQTALTSQTAYTAKGTATKVPQITTNALGQVTAITEVDIQASGGGNLTIVGVESGTSAINAATGNYYRIGGSVGTLSIVLPSMGNETEVKGCVFAFTTASSSVAVTITSNDSKSITYYDGYAIEASKSYEINAIYNGSVWVIAYGLIQTA